MIAALLLFSILPGTEEIFFNAMHIQFHLALCAALILALDVPGRRRGRVAYNALLVLAPLCGPGAIAILPLFALRALIDRDIRRAEQFALFAAGSAIQLLLFFSANPMRGDPRGPVTVAATMLVRLFALPTLGIDKADYVGDALYRSDAAGGAGLWWAAGAACLLIGALVIAASRRRDAAIWLMFSTLLIAAATFGFGMVIVRRFDLFDVGAGERYNFLPMALIGLTLIVLATRADAPGRTACGAVCALMLVIGAVHYPRPLPAFRDGPSWAAEVAAWRLDHRHPLAVWPQPWAADLSDENRRCSPVGPDTPTSHDPRYCESGWIAAFFRPPLSTGHDTQLAARLSAWASRRNNGAP